jgi:chromatin segregation and condensation protein Rec8/ScpA/Scc1 (kleisin family)
MAMPVRELELDLEAFEGPFDLLLALVLRDELDLGEVDVAGIVLAFLERLAEREVLDLDACGEFLVLVAALLELKARALLTGEETDLEDLDPAEAAAELARRLAEYRRIKEAAAARRPPDEESTLLQTGPLLAPKVECPWLATRPSWRRFSGPTASRRPSHSRPSSFDSRRSSSSSTGSGRCSCAGPASTSIRKCTN